MSLRRALSGTALALLVLFGPAAVWAAQVVVVETTGSRLYRHALKGFNKAFSGEKISIRVEGEMNDPEKLSAAIRREQPRVIVAVGLGAARLVIPQIQDIPIVFCMANNPEKHKLKQRHTTGVLLEPDPAQQLKAFADLLPQAKRIGIIFDQTASGRFVAAAERASARLGLKLDTIRVQQASQIPDALKELSSRVDALWLLRDAKVTSRAFFEQTILLQYTLKLPVLAYSDQFVQKGALASFSADYKEQGRMAAALCQALLDGKTTEELGLVPPDGHLTVNEEAARQAGIILSDKLRAQKGIRVIGGKGGGHE